MGSGTSITVDEWRAEVDKLDKPMMREDGWISVAQYARLATISTSTARLRLEKGAREGRYAKATGLYRHENGCVRMSTVYRINTEAPA